MSPEDLNRIIGKIRFPRDDKTLVGFDENDDAGVYRLTADIALVQTVDFITPVVDDPYVYGQIAAANSLSDVFAMGARVCTAMNLVAYDNCHVTPEMLQEILKGGADKVREAGGVIVGGHTIEDVEMKYGLAVTGIVHPDRILRNNSLQPGDNLILTKPLGTGVISTAIKADMAADNVIRDATFHMCYLNRIASEIAIETYVNAMTDITGFGLIGHLLEMNTAGFGIELDHEQILIMEGALELAETGLFPSGSYRNRDYFQPSVLIRNRAISDDLAMLYYDAQTSGGLLISVSEEKADLLLGKLHAAGLEWCRNIGIVNAAREDRVVLY